MSKIYLNDEVYYIEHIKYHSSWDWQIPVWSKVRLALATLADESAENHCFWGECLMDYYAGVDTNNIIEAFEVVVKSIQFLHSQTQAK